MFSPLNSSYQSNDNMDRKYDPANKPQPGHTNSAVKPLASSDQIVIDEPRPEVEQQPVIVSDIPDAPDAPAGSKEGVKLIWGKIWRDSSLYSNVRAYPKVNVTIADYNPAIYPAKPYYNEELDIQGKIHSVFESSDFDSVTEKRNLISTTIDGRVHQLKKTELADGTATYSARDITRTKTGRSTLNDTLSQKVANWFSLVGYAILQDFTAIGYAAMATMSFVQAFFSTIGNGISYLLTRSTPFEAVKLGGEALYYAKKSLYSIVSGITSPFYGLYNLAGANRLQRATGRTETSYGVDATYDGKRPSALEELIKAKTEAPAKAEAAFARLKESLTYVKNKIAEIEKAIAETTKAIDNIDSKLGPKDLLTEHGNLNNKLENLIEKHEELTANALYLEKQIDLGNLSIEEQLTLAQEKYADLLFEYLAGKPSIDNLIDELKNLPNKNSFEESLLKHYIDFKNKYIMDLIELKGNVANLKMDSKYSGNVKERIDCEAESIEETGSPENQQKLKDNKPLQEILKNLEQNEITLDNFETTMLSYVLEDTDKEFDDEVKENKIKEVNKKLSAAIQPFVNDLTTQIERQEKELIKETEEIERARNMTHEFETVIKTSERIEKLVEKNEEQNLKILLVLSDLNEKLMIAQHDLCTARLKKLQIEGELAAAKNMLAQIKGEPSVDQAKKKGS